MIRRLGWILLALFGLVSSASAKSFVWQVEKNGQKAFIGGTIHILRPQDRLPDAYQRAYQQSDLIVTEVKGSELTSRSTVMKMTSMGMYQNGDTLDKHLSPEVFAELKQFCHENKFPLEPMMTMKPSMVSVTISMGMMMRYGVTAEGIDMKFLQQAKRDRKSNQGLESIDQQLNALFNSGANPDEIIRYTLNDAKQLDKLMGIMIDGLFNGDVELFERELLLPMKNSTPEYYDALIKNRNNNWLSKIDNLMSTPAVEFILVGGLHLVGDDGVINLLRKKGYSTKQL
jgi:uncharacterized protein YbaP (TraB family)